MKPWKIDSFGPTAREFKRRALAPMLAAGGRDGDLSRLDEVLADADSAGLMSFMGDADTLEVVEEIATACAGVATAVHVASLAAIDLAEASLAPPRAAVALFDEPLGAFVDYPEARDALLPWVETRVVAKDGGRVLRGRKRFVFAAPGTTTFVVYARDEIGWLRIALPADASELLREQTDDRLGLAACSALHLTFRDIPVADAQVLDRRNPIAFLTRLWAGITAIAVGNARGALDAARRYASERVQGGAPIRELPAVKLMLGAAEARIETCRAALYGDTAHRAGDSDTLRRAAMIKLRVTDETARAVSDCLQVFGGYGYMEDYRIEKRLRDASSLRAGFGRPDDLTLYVASSVVGAP